MKKAEIIIFQKEADYREFFNKNFVKNKIFFRGIEVSFIEDDFNHIFYEKSKEGEEVFSERRAKRMMFVKSILSEKFNVELMFQMDRKTFAIFCIDLECVVYLRNRVGSGKLQIGTFFDFGKNHNKMYLKQKKKCIEITPQDFRNIVLNSCE
jgi:hypothetical protein